MTDRAQADHKYSVSTKGRERRRRADARYSAKRRAKKFGVSLDDIQKLINAQGGVCPLTERPVTTRSAVDHAWDMSGVDALRGVIDGQVNTILPNDDHALAKFAGNLLAYSTKRQVLHRYLECSSLQRG
jgi:hypothetical protein